jgi:hypothetical protein
MKGVKESLFCKDGAGKLGNPAMKSSLNPSLNQVAFMMALMAGRVR